MFSLTNVKTFSVCVSKAILDHPKFCITTATPGTISASLDTVLKNFGKMLAAVVSRGEVAAGDI